MSKPPAKQPGKKTGPRRLDGMLMDVSATAAYLGESEDAVRAQISRHVLPSRRWGKRVVVIRAELDQFLAQLPGVSAAEP
jgi:hypothetical protein